MLSLPLFALALGSVRAQSLDVNSADSIRSAAKIYAGKVVNFYSGNDAGNTPGLLPKDYFWWEAGSMFDLLVNYWHYTGDSQYNTAINQGLLFQKGEDNNFMPSNQTKTLGNSDQVFWALAAISASVPPTEGNPSWLTLADAVFQSQVERWDAETCGGGLRWQVFSFNAGYNYKNAESNGGFFQLASRLARLKPQNTTYAEWAGKAFDWSTSIGLVDSTWNVYDGTDITTNCSSINHVQWSHLAAMYTTGAAHMYAATGGAAKWKTALDGLLSRTLAVFFPSSDIMAEIGCETVGTCTVDAQACKSMTARWLADTAALAPYTASLILPKLKASAQAAVAKCGDMECSFSWTEHPYPATVSDGLGPAMNALAVVQALLVESANDTAIPGNSSGNATTTAATTGGGNGAALSGTGVASASSTSPTATSKTSSASSEVGLRVRVAWLGMASALIGFSTFLALWY